MVHVIHFRVGVVVIVMIILHGIVARHEAVGGVLDAVPGIVSLS
jgi:hypothetical protein